MKAKEKQTGFTLIELMIVVAIIGVLAAIALPAYELYGNRSRFSEAVMAVDDSKNSLLIAAQLGRFNSINDADSGSNGIPPAIAQAASTHGIAIVDGAITITWKTDGTDLAGATYTLTAQGIVPPIQWLESGSCKASGYC